MKRKIASHDKKIIKSSSVEENSAGCICRKSNLRPMQGNCKVSEIVYKANVMESDTTKGIF